MHEPLTWVFAIAGFGKPVQCNVIENFIEQTKRPQTIGYHEVDKGGPFAAWEQPQLFAEEVRAAFKSLR